jgi:hypothetical protein
MGHIGLWFMLINVNLLGANINTIKKSKQILLQAIRWMI